MKKSAKIFSVILAVLTAACMFSSCSRNKRNAPVSSVVSQKPKEHANVAVLKGPTAIGLLHLMKSAKIDSAHNDYDFSVFTAPDQAVAAISNGSIDIACLPTNVASVLYNKTQKGISILAVNTLGTVDIVSTRNDIKSVADLKGKTVYMAGKGATPEYVLNYILEKNSLKVGEDVNVVFKTDHAELAALVLTGEADVALLPEPFVTSVLEKGKDKNVKKVINLTQEWNSVKENDGASLVMGCIVARNEYINAHKDAVETFLNECEASISGCSELDITKNLCNEFQIMDGEYILGAIGACTFISRDQMKQSVSKYLSILYESNPASVGGNLPGEDFYYSR